MTQLPISCHCLTSPQLFLQKLEFVFWGDNQEPSGVNFQKLDPSRPARQSSSMLDEGHRIQHFLDIPPGAQASSYLQWDDLKTCAQFLQLGKVQNSQLCTWLEKWKWIHLKTKQLQICDSKFKFILGKSNSARSNPKIQLGKKSIHFSQTSWSYQNASLKRYKKPMAPPWNPLNPSNQQENLGFNDLTLFRNFVTKSVHFLEQSFHLSFRLLSVKHARGQFQILRHNVSSSWACSKLQKNVTTSHSTKKTTKNARSAEEKTFSATYFQWNCCCSESKSRIQGEGSLGSNPTRDKSSPWNVALGNLHLCHPSSWHHQASHAALIASSFNAAWPDESQGCSSKKTQLQFMGKKLFLPTNHLLVVSWSSKHHHLHQRWSPLKFPLHLLLGSCLSHMQRHTSPTVKGLQENQKDVACRAGVCQPKPRKQLGTWNVLFLLSVLLLCWGEFVRPREHLQNKHHPSLCLWVKLLWALKSIQIAHLRSSLRSEWCALLLPSQVLKWLDSWMNIGLMSEKIWNEVD